MHHSLRRAIDAVGKVFGRARLPPSRCLDACTCFAAQRELRPPEMRMQKWAVALLLLAMTCGPFDVSAKD